MAADSKDTLTSGVGSAANTVETMQVVTMTKASIKAIILFIC